MKVEPLKNLYTPELIREFAEQVAYVYPPFNQEGFTEAVLGGNWEQLELKDRYRHIAVQLGKYLPEDFGQAIKILEPLAPRYTGLPYLFFSEFVAVYGLHNPDRGLALQALKTFTPIASSEFAIRPFIEQDQDQTLAVMLEWTRDESEQVRRLASEGCRPRLPWAGPLRRLIADPAPILPILSALKADPSEFVRRSVANNLNDISKDHPALVLELAAQWLGTDKDTDRMLKHACRTLLKKSDPEALQLFGFEDSGENLVEIADLTVQPDSIPIGGEIRFTFTLRSPEPYSFKLQYAVDYVKANGKTSPKRFHLTEKKDFSGEHKIDRGLSFQNYTTRKHYPGQHRLAILVNGVEKGSVSFQVEE